MGESRGKGSDLPAVYVDPWRLLGRDLRAVLASLRLRLWELGRRNRGGELWRPPFWPASLAPLFWPLALALLLIALVAGGLAIRGVSPVGEGPAGVEAPPAVEAPAREPPVVVEAPGPPIEALPPDGSQGDSPADPAVELPVETPALAPPAAEPPPPDPLLSALGETGASPLLQAARSEPARRLLVLTAAPSYAALAPAKRQERAEAWWRQGQELGYEHLEVRDGRRRLLVRSALVGGGLVLFEPEATGVGGDPA
jgi:hypothetical protein